MSSSASPARSTSGRFDFGTNSCFRMVMSTTWSPVYEPAAENCLHGFLQCCHGRRLHGAALHGRLLLHRLHGLHGDLCLHHVAARPLAHRQCLEVDPHRPHAGRMHGGKCCALPHPRLRCELGRNAYYLLLASITDQSPIRTNPTGGAPTGRTLFTCTIRHTCPPLGNRLRRSPHPGQHRRRFA